MKKIIVALSFVLLAGCTSSAYTENLNLGKDELKKENYEEAIISFEKANKEDDTEVVKILLKTTELLLDAKSAFAEGEFEVGIYNAKKIISIKNDDNSFKLIKGKASKLIEDANKAISLKASIEDNISKGKSLLEQNLFDQAYETFNQTSSVDVPSNNDSLTVLKNQAVDLMKKTLDAKNKYVQEQEEQKKVAEAEKKRKAEEAQKLDDEANKKKQKDEEAKKVAAEAEKKKEAEKVKTISESEAAKRVRDYLDLPSNPNVHAEFDHKADNGDYIIHVYEIVIDDPTTKEGHYATWGWYGVDPDEGYVYDALGL